MRIYSDYMTVQTKQNREFINITQNVKFAVEKSGIRDGVVLVTVLHSNSAVLLNEDDSGLLQDLEAWLAQLAPVRDDYKYGPRHESNAAIHLQSLLLQNHVVLGLADGKLELGPWQSIIYAELDGNRPKRLLFKVLGE
jgi:secondary thiamine-phosphate synthase enzyme